MPEARPLNVFIAHASQDKPAVRELYKSLKKETWISPWLDEEELLPGMDWDYEIYKAFRDADVIIACLSQESVAKEGYVQREFKRALSYAEEKPEGTIYVIPLRLDDCTPPHKLNKYQWVDYFVDGAENKLLKALYQRAKNLQILLNPALKSSQKVVQAAKKTSPPIISQTSTPSVMKVNKHKIYTFAGMEFLHIPAGEFWMGANDIEDIEGAAKPEHLVYLDYDFYIARFPLTNRLYARYVRDKIVSKKNAQHPVADVSWNDAQKYIAWLNQKHKNELPQGFRFCLSSEAEWEKTARGSDGNEYPWGNTFDKSRCNSEESGIGNTTPVGKFSPQGDSFYGAADMAGNVWEWTRSLWGNGWEPSFKYPYNFDDGREDEKVEKQHVIRGGSWAREKKYVRCAFRKGLSWGPLGILNFFFNYKVGFRVCVSPIS